MQHWRIWGRSHAARRHWLVRRGNGASLLRDDSSLRDGQVAEEEGGSTIVAHQAMGCRATGPPV